MLAYNSDIFSILERRVEAKELTGFYGGVFSADRQKFVGCTYVPLDTADADAYRYLFSMGYSVMGADTEKTKKYLADKTYQYKDVSECISEGLYKAFSIRFYAAYFEGSWFVLRDFLFWGEQKSEEDAKELLETGSNTPDYWNNGGFATNLSTEAEARQFVRNIDTEVYPDMPWLVSHIKAECKRKVKDAFVAYANAAFVQPFFQKMRIRFFEAYSEFQPLFGDDFTLVFPENRKYFLVVAMARHQMDGFRLVWFFYDMNSGIFYRWTYPQPVFSEWSFHYAEDVINNLKSISDWDDYAFLTSSRTMDDVHFWQEFVLKREADGYKWLESLSS